MVAPTIARREAYLDVLRGIAVLGILLANIASYSGPMAEQMLMIFSTPAEGVDLWVEAATDAFVTGKFRSMLGLLFGIGLYMQYQKRSAVAGNWPGGYLKRNFYLGLLGVVHGLFIWYGDILFFYSLVAFGACFIVGMSARALKMTIGILAAIAGVAAIGLTALLFAIPPEEFDLGTFGKILSQDKELAVYQTGSYWEQLKTRAIFFGLFAANFPFYAPLFLPLFLLGFLFARSRALAAPSKHLKTRKMALWVGIGIGLPLNLLAFAVAPTGKLWMLMGAWELFVGPLLAIGYLMLGAMWVESGRFKSVLSALGRVGRVALTCYLMQSVLCTMVYYSWGFGLFGKLTAVENVLVALGVWACNIVFATLWLRKFDIGPVEWAWRSATEGRRHPWRHEPAKEAPPPPPAPAFEL